MKIKHKNKGHYGKTLNIPYDGEVEIGVNGTTEVSEKAAKLLLTKSPDWEQIPGQKDVLKTTSTKNTKTSKSAPKASKQEEPEEDEELAAEDDEDIDTEGSAADEDDANEPEASELDGMDLDNLINIAQTSEIVGWEKFKNSEKGLRTFLKNRLNS